MLTLPDTPDVSPWHLLQHYVALTAHQAQEVTLLLRALKAPFAPLQANNVGSLTRELLKGLGVDVSHWTPHSTRGAGVAMYKKLGLSSEEVCKVGKWKNVQAFSTHYLRLGAAAHASEKLRGLVHTVSSWRSAEPDLSRTPGRNYFDQGGRDKEGGAQSQDEPASPTLSAPSSSSVEIGGVQKRPLSSKGSVSSGERLKKRLRDQVAPLRFTFKKPGT